MRTALQIASYKKNAAKQEYRYVLQSTRKNYKKLNKGLLFKIKQL